METKAYLMIKASSKGNGHTEKMIKELKTIPFVESVTPVSGEYDLVAVASLDSPKEVNGLVDQIKSAEWVKDLQVLKVEPLAPNPFLNEVLATPGAETLSHCHQCGMCSASCPNVSHMDYTPRRIIAMVRAGRRTEVLTSNTMWTCASCYICTARCPQGVKITEIMHALERLSVRHGMQAGKNTATMYDAFVKNIKNNGLICEVSMMTRFYMSTILSGKMNPLILLKMGPVAMNLLTHNRMPVLPTKTKGAEQLRAIMDKAESFGGKE